jgi:hypothetical protein
MLIIVCFFVFWLSTASATVCFKEVLCSIHVHMKWSVFYLISRKLLSWLPITQLLTLYKVCNVRVGGITVCGLHLAENSIEYSFVSQSLTQRISDIKQSYPVVSRYSSTTLLTKFYGVARISTVLPERLKLSLRKKAQNEGSPSLSEKLRSLAGRWRFLHLVEQIILCVLITRDNTQFLVVLCLPKVLTFLGCYISTPSSSN